MSIDQARLARLLYPETIAVCGGTICGQVIDYCKAHGFAGKISAINPHRDRLSDIDCVADIADLPCPPDALFLGLKHEACIDIIDKAAKMGVGGVVCYASGFAELGDDSGNDRQARLIDAAGSMPIIGPNCYGLINYLDRVSLWPDVSGDHQPTTGVAILSQSGNMALNLSMSNHALPLAFVIALGNQANCDAGALMKVLAKDVRVSAIGIHIEGISNPVSLFEGLQAVHTANKPIVIFKTAITAQSHAMAFGHTASISGQHDVFLARMQAMGVAIASNYDEFLASLTFLHIHGTLPDKRLLSLSCSGGEATMVSDYAQHYDVNLIDFTNESVARIHDQYTAQIHCVNPFDYHTYHWGNEDMLYAIFDAAMQTRFDAATLIIDFPNTAPDHTKWQAALNAFARACAARDVAPIICATMRECQPPSIARALAQQNLIPIIAIDVALGAVQNAYLARRRTQYLPPIFKASSAILPLDEFSAKGTLAQLGLNVPNGFLVDRKSALPIDLPIAYPLCVKPCDATLQHKTETGLIALNIETYADLLAAVSACHNGGFAAYCEEMITDNLSEVLISIGNDYACGLYLTIAPGGVMSELARDKIIIALPTTKDTIDNALRKSPLFEFICGYRQQRTGNINALVTLCDVLATHVCDIDTPTLAIELNPVIIGEHHVMIADALMQRRKS